MCGIRTWRRGGRSVCGGLICEMLEAGEGGVVMMRYYYQSLKGGGGGVGTRFELKVKDHGVMKTCRGDEMS